MLTAGNMRRIRRRAMRRSRDFGLGWQVSRNRRCLAGPCAARAGTRPEMNPSTPAVAVRMSGQPAPGDENTPQRKRLR